MNEIEIELIKERVLNCSYEDLASIHSIVCSGSWNYHANDLTNDTTRNKCIESIHHSLVHSDNKQISKMYDKLHAQILI